MENKKVDIVDLEEKKSFDFFWNTANSDENSLGYGLIPDNSAPQDSDRASIASVGFGLAGIPIGIERGWITKEEGYKRAHGTLLTFLNQVEEVGGFFYHFLDMETGKKYKNNFDVPSIIDTTLFLSGAIVAGEYFEGEIKSLVNKIFDRVDWTMYYNKEKNLYYMGYREGEGGFGAWDMYAEQLVQYVLGVGSNTHGVPAKIFEGFERKLVSYKDYKFYTSPGNALFIHQYAHGFVNFSNYTDPDGINWGENSKIATLAQRQYAIDNPEGFKTFNKDSWGLTACQGPEGYRVYGTPPSVDIDLIDGTVAPSAAIGSIVFTPKESIALMENLYHNHPETFGEFGFVDAYNFDKEPDFYSDRVIGIDKGITLVMIENYRTGLIWNLFKKSEIVKSGLKRLAFKEIEND